MFKLKSLSVEADSFAVIKVGSGILYRENPAKKNKLMLQTTERLSVRQSQKKNEEVKRVIFSIKSRGIGKKINLPILMQHPCCAAAAPSTFYTQEIM